MQTLSRLTDHLHQLLRSTSDSRPNDFVDDKWLNGRLDALRTAYRLCLRTSDTLASCVTYTLCLTLFPRPYHIKQTDTSETRALGDILNYLTYELARLRYWSNADERSPYGLATEATYTEIIDLVKASITQSRILRRKAA